MALTHDIKDPVRERLRSDPLFRKALLTEIVNAMFVGDVRTAMSVLRDYVNATVGFAKLAEATKIPPTSLMRMLSASGNPRTEKLFAIIAALQKKEGLQVELILKRTA
jgi:DNA-binding phage protein